MIYKIRNNKGQIKILIDEVVNLHAPRPSYRIYNIDGEGIEISRDCLVKYLQDIIDKEI